MCGEGSAMQALANLARAFLQIGAFSFGGGYAMIPLLREQVEKYGWLTEGEFFDIIGISEMTPGPVAINFATFIGFKVGGFWGSALATGCVILVPVILVLILARLFSAYEDVPWVKRILQGLRPATIALIASALLFVGKGAFLDAKSLIIAGIAGILLQRGLHPVLTLIVGATLGVVLY